MDNQQYPPQGGYPPQQGYGQAPYGAPPPNQYPPQGQYGAPPPPQGYGQYQQPPPGQYGAPQGQYGAPPPPLQGYASPPPPGQWGAPPPQQGQFGAPPPQGQYSVQSPQPGFGGPPTQPSLGYGPQQTANINVLNDVEAIRKAMKGFGTDEKALIAILSKKDPIQINTIRTQYDQRFMRSMVVDLEKETSGYFARGLAEISRGPLVSDCHNLMNAMKGLGTKESILDDILIGRSNADLNAIKQKYQEFKNDAQLRAIAQSYQQRFQKPLDAILKSSFSGHMQDALRLLVHRATNRAEAEAVRLEESMAGLGTKDELLVQRVVRCHWDRNFMNAVSQAYQQVYRKDLVKRIEGETRGDYERLMVACVRP
ncbi:annexin XIV [Pyrenophora seminiperda CCB06]|uniref:Annexin XIV n=1 Tax=Pyrenophora seminiperda CCB06 TaxID=1302712 RepID=A0A3M7M5A7_9PLEO|nr:annexin XIV [Pyrenophora seminiperda CCB06]